MSHPDSSMYFLNFEISQIGAFLNVASPVVLARQSRTVISRLAGKIFDIANGPGRFRVVVTTMGFLKAGIYLETGSFRFSKPSSHSIMAAVPVIGLVSE